MSIIIVCGVIVYIDVDLPFNAITPTLWKYDSKEKWSKNEEFEVNRNVTLEFVVSCLFRRRIEITEIFNWQYIQKIYYSFEIFPTNYSFEIFPRNVCRLTCAWPYPSFLFNFLFEWNYFKSDGKTWYNNTNIIYLIIRLMDFAVCISMVLTSVLVNTYHFMTTQCPSRRFNHGPSSYAANWILVIPRTFKALILSARRMMRSLNS